MRHFSVSVIISFVFLSACDGGGTGTSTVAPPLDPGSYPTLHPDAAAIYRDTAEFRAVGLTPAEENSFRQQLGLAPLCAGETNPNCTNSSPYELQNIHFAHTATLASGKNVKGDGQLIAIVDDGFRVSHREFQGKQILTYLGATANLNVDHHGTSVAGIAAANADGRGMMGVAPEAALHLTSWGNVSSSNFLSHLTGATLDARSKGASVQNNSWGWTSEVAASHEMAAFKASGAATYADYLPGRLGGTSGQWSNLFSAYNTFQQGGVIVFANSNDSSLPDAEAWAALPLFVPELKGAWIVAANALFSVDGSTGKILNSDLISAPCGSAAAFCLTADGTVYAPTASSNTSYGLMTGTSFAAPQISGQIALLSQAFPNLAPHELTTRLLATAQNDWAGFQQTVSGNVQFGANVSRPVSHLYGLGVPDMAAALAPVGGLSVATGEHVATSARYAINDGLEAAAPLIGGRLSNLIADQRLMVIDQLGSDFYLRGAELTKPGNGGRAQPNSAEALAGDVEALGFSFMQTEPKARRFEDTALTKLFFSQAHQNAAGSTTFSRLMAVNEDEFFQFSGQLQKDRKGDAISFGMSRFLKRGPVSIETMLSGGHATNSFFGSFGTGPFVSAQHSSNIATGMSVTAPFVPGWSLTGFVEIGAGSIAMKEASLATYGPMVHGSAGFSLTSRQLFGHRDQLTLYGGIRPTAIAGTGVVRLPVSRDQEGQIQYQELRFGLANADIPLRVGFNYETAIAGDFKGRFSMNSDFHVRGKPSTSFAIGLNKVF